MSVDRIFALLMVLAAVVAGELIFRMARRITHYDDNREG